MNTKATLKFLGFALALFALTLGPIGCERTIHVTEKMTWQCAPNEYKPAFSAKPDEYVRFRYVENPHCFEVLTSKNFCAELQDAVKSTVDVDFEVWGRSKKVQGYRIVAVDGRPLQQTAGWGGSGANDYSGPSPIDNAFRAH